MAFRKQVLSAFQVNSRRTLFYVWAIGYFTTRHRLAVIYCNFKHLWEDKNDKKLVGKKVYVTSRGALQRRVHVMF